MPVARAIAELGRAVFLDLKLHDIPATVAHAVRAVARLGMCYLTVDLTGGGAMVREAQLAAEEGGGLTLLGVTLLTSIDADEAQAIGFEGTPQEIVARLGRLGLAAGIGGFVTSGAELGRLRAMAPGAVIAVPGVRRAQDALGDQRRVVTPQSARSGGADLIVVGRPIIRAEDPIASARSFVQELALGGAA